MGAVFKRVVQWFATRSAWQQLGRVTEILIIDVLIGIVVMLGLSAFTAVARALSIESKEIAYGVTFAHLFRIGHALNILIVLYFSLQHLVRAFRGDHD